MNSSLRVKLNGTWLTGRIDGTSNFEVTLRRQDASGRTAKSFSSELTFYDDGYQILKTNLIDNPNGFAAEIPIEIWDDCCGTAQFNGVIKGDAIDWCEPDCAISANIIETTPEYNCVQSTIIWDNWNGFLNVDRPAMRYCIDVRPEFIQIVQLYAAALVGFILTVIILPLALVVAIIGILVIFICSIVCAIPGTSCTQQDCNESNFNPANVFEQAFNILETLTEWAIPCGRFHPSALVIDYILNVCQKCGLQFQSSILYNPNSPYISTVLFAAQVMKGRKRGDTNYTLITENLPTETLASFLDNVLKPTFNADWRIIGNTLIFERKDYFQGTAVWIDAASLLDNGKISENKICYSWIERERWAFGRFEYSPDAQEYVGNEAMPRYNDIVDWNVPFNPAQSGQYQMSLPISPARVRGDGIESAFYEAVESDGGIIDAFLGGILQQYNNALLLNNHTAFQYKLLIYRGVDPVYGTVKTQYPDSFTGGMVFANNAPIPPGQRHNYPYWFKEGNANNLYSLFHYIDDPRLPTSTQFNFDFTFEFTCNDLANFDWGKTVRLLKNGQIVYGQIEEVKLNFVTRTATVSGIV